MTSTTPFNHRELGVKGQMVKPEGSWFKVGAEMDYYDRKGNKQFGVVRTITDRSVTIQNAYTRKPIKITFVK